MFHRIETPPRIDPTAYVAPGAIVVGDVLLGPEASVWFHAVVRGDTERIEIAARANIQDQAVLHADPGFPCTIGQDSTVGHSAVVHGATVGEHAMIGIGAIVLNGAVVEPWSIVAAGAVVPEGVKVASGAIVGGTPAKVIGQVNKNHRERIERAARNYVAAAKAYAEKYTRHAPPQSG